MKQGSLFELTATKVVEEKDMDQDILFNNYWAGYWIKDSPELITSSFKKRFGRVPEYIVNGQTMYYAGPLENQEEYRETRG